MTETTKFATAYMDEALFELPDVIERATKHLAEVDYDTIVGAGFSGGVVVPALALALNKNFALVRKETDDSHHGRGRILGQIGKRWIFVDDVVSSGSTRRRVIDKINVAEANSYSYAPERIDTEYIGTYLYVRAARGLGGFDPASTHHTPTPPVSQRETSVYSSSLAYDATRLAYETTRLSGTLTYSTDGLIIR